MRNSYGWVGAAALVFLGSAIGCSDDSKGGGDGDGDGDRPGTGGFVISGTGGRSSGGSDAIDPCFGELVYCSSGCVDLSADEDNCGSCGERCAADGICEDGTCERGASPGGAHGGGAGGGAGSPN